MRKKVLYLAGGMAMLAVPAFSAGPDHLVISEFATRGGSYTNAHESSEYIEIYNPTGSEFSLANYYLTDYAQYYKLPAIALPSTGTGDYLAKFPSDAVIPSGGVVVVTANSANFLIAYFNDDLANFTSQTGTPQLFEMTDGNASVTDMVNLNQNTTADSANLSHTDGGESQFLFNWDGTTNNVKDVDMVLYAAAGVDLGTSNGFRGKADAGTASPYLADNGGNANLTVRYQVPGPAGYQYARRSLIEVGENNTGGNGITGHDESLEQCNVTFVGKGESIATATPGIVDLPLSSANQPPVIVSTARGAVADGSPVHITAVFVDDSSIASAAVNVDNGSGVVPVTMTNDGGGNWSADIGPYSNGAQVTWFVTVTDDGGLTSNEADFKTFNVPYNGSNSFTVVATPVTDNDILFTEIMFDPPGSDNSGGSEFVEMYNRSGAAIDLSFYQFSSSKDDGRFTVTFPRGTIVPSKGYLVMAASKPLFLLNFPGIDPSTVFDCNWQRSSTLGNSGGTPALVAPNDVGGLDQPSVATESVAYTNNTPWPGTGVANTGASNTGYTLELKDATGANTTGDLWGVSVPVGGTPGRRNSLDNPGNIQITEASRTVEYPATTTPIVMEANVTGNNVISSVSALVDTGSGYVSHAMALDTGSTYSVDLGVINTKTLVKYYVEATDSNGQTMTFPPSGAIVSFWVDDNFPATDDLVISEIMSDPTDAENVDHSEWIEIYNRSSNPVDLSYFLIGPPSQYGRQFSNGVVIPSHGYVIFAGNKPKFVTDYPGVDSNIVLDALYAGSIIANAPAVPGQELDVIHANAVNWHGTNVPLDTVSYTNEAPWPVITQNFTRELADLSSDNADGANWAISQVDGGTPAFENSTSGVPDWSVY